MPRENQVVLNDADSTLPFFVLGKQLDNSLQLQLNVSSVKTTEKQKLMLRLQNEYKKLDIPEVIVYEMESLEEVNQHLNERNENIIDVKIINTGQKQKSLNFFETGFDLGLPNFHYLNIKFENNFKY
jgi:hypothetical protein